MAIMTIASHCVGLTLPGMIDEPGSLLGSFSSASPQRGPEASQRMSLAILISATASPRIAAWPRTMASRAQRHELVGRGNKWLCRQVRNLLGHLPREALRRIKPR